MDGFITKALDQHDLFEQLEVVGRTALARDAPPAETSVTPLISDPDISRHVAGLFRDTAPGQLDRLRRAVDAHDGSDVTTTAHSLRGAMAHFTGARLDHLERLEEAGRQNRLDGAPAILAHVESDVADVLALLASRRDLQ